VIYAVHVAVASVTLGRGTAALASVASVVSIGLLVYWHAYEVDPGHHRFSDFPTHLLIMWVALTAITDLAAYFVLQASTALARREQALEVMRVRAARSERLASLTTLAAGAAHELSTPLATIALAARELEHAAEGAADSTFSDDARLIRLEVDRCRAILDQMSGRAESGTDELREPVDVGQTLANVRAQLPAEMAHRLVIEPVPPLVVDLSSAAFAQALSSLIRNGFEASPPDAPVTVTAARIAESFRITIRDEGYGMPSEVLARAGDPFFTTKEPGKGLGLGLFLARMFVERSGGTLTLESGEGTTVIVDLPLSGAEQS
jgi:two-component system, sensor histidine kinase RegB